MTVADLLAASRAAHQRSFQHRGRIDAQGRMSQRPGLRKAGRAIEDAVKWRLEAQALDPHHRDPAWLDDQAANKGASSDEMIAFLGRYLTPVEARG